MKTRNLFFRFTFALLRAEKRGGTAKCLTTPQRNKKEMQSTINTNKSLLLKILYDINHEVFLQCFSKNLHT